MMRDVASGNRASNCDTKPKHHSHNTQALGIGSNVGDAPMQDAQRADLGWESEAQAADQRVGAAWKGPCAFLPPGLSCAAG